MRLLLIGGGGREHALAWKLAQSPQVETIYAAPGNPGIALLDKCECIDLPLQELEKLADYAEANCIDLTVVGPEASLVEGIADVLRQEVWHCLDPVRRLQSWKVLKLFLNS